MKSRKQVQDVSRKDSQNQHALEHGFRLRLALCLKFSSNLFPCCKDLHLGLREGLFDFKAGFVEAREVDVQDVLHLQHGSFHVVINLLKA